MAAGVLFEGDRIVHVFRSSQTNTAQRRLDIWRSSVNMLRDHPVLGVGPDNFLHYYAPTRKEDLWQRECTPGVGYMMPDAGAEPCLSHPHNEFLDFWLSSGVLGLGAFIWIEIAFWRCALQVWRRAGSTLDRVLLLGTMGAMLAGLLHGLVDNSYFLMDLSIIFWLLCAYVGKQAEERIS
jgi:O-antigen ligase